MCACARVRVCALFFPKTKAAEYAAAMVKKNERTVRRWQSGLIKNKGILPDSQQGHYQRTGLLWKNKELNKKAREYVQANTAVEGRPNITAPVFCRWERRTERMIN